MTNARELTSRLVDLLRHERSAMADFLVALADFDRKKVWRELGYASLFHFLHRELGMSKGAAHYRKTAAELVLRVPEVVEPLRDGRLCITSIIELAKVLTLANREEVLPRFFHRSRQEAKAVSAELRPAEAAPHRTVVTAIPQAVAGGARTATLPPRSPVALPLLADSGGQAAPARLSAAPGAVPAVQPVEPEVRAPAGRSVQRAAPRNAAEPLTADLRRLHVTVSKRFMEKLEAAKDALSHSHPSADAEAILEAGLDLLIERAAKRKGMCTRPKAEKPPQAAPVVKEGRGATPKPGEEERNPRFIPAAVKREVWVRDSGRCQWKLANGEICGSTHRMQFDHIDPVALGGASTVANIRLTCRDHNILAARRVFGDSFMDRFAPGRTTGSLFDAR